MPSALERIGEVAGKDKKVRFTTLMLGLLRDAPED